MAPKQQGQQHTNVTESRSVKVPTLRFYQDDRFVLEKGSQGHRRVLWGDESAVAQLDGVDGNSLLQADLPGSILGMGALHIAYSPYGHRAIDAVAAMLGFTGQHPELLTEGYLLGNGHRMFSPTLMRFYSEDALSPFEKGGINAYAYCSGDPVNNVDPSGRALAPNITLMSKQGGWLFSKAAKRHTTPQDSNVTRPLIEQLASKQYKAITIKATDYNHTKASEYHAAVSEMRRFNSEHGIFKKDNTSLGIPLFEKSYKPLPADYARSASPAAAPTASASQRQPARSGLTVSDTKYWDDRKPLTLKMPAISKWRQQKLNETLESLK